MQSQTSLIRDSKNASYCTQLLRRNRSILAAAVITSAIAVPISNVQAAARTWVGNTDANLGSSGNWDTLPVSGDSWAFGAAGTSGTALTNNLATADTFQVAGLTFTASSGFAISGGAFTLAGDVTATGTSTAAVTIGSNVTISGSRTVFLNSTGGQNLTLSGSLLGSGTLNLRATAGSTAKSLILSGDNSGFTGSFFETNDSNVRLAFNNAAAGSASAAWTFDRNVAGGVALNIANSTINFGSLAGNAQMRCNSAGTTTLSVGALGTSTTYTGQINDNGASNIALTKIGAGTLTLSGTSSYDGATNITGGTLALSGVGAINGASAGAITINGSGARYRHNSTVVGTRAITLNDGTLDGSGSVGVVTVAGTSGVVSNGTGVTGNTSTLTASAITYTAAGSFSLNKANDLTTPAVTVSGALTSVPGITINIPSSVTWTNGSTYNLIGYGSFTGNTTDFALGTVAGLGARQAGTIGSAGNFITLTINGDMPYWTGAASGAWTTNIVGSPYNWKLQTAGTGTDFIANDQALFNDSATGATAVDISTANVSPASVQFANSTKNYSISSSGGFGIVDSTTPTALSKSGTGTLTIGTANTYSGGTTLNSGTIALTGAGTLGSSTGLVSINGGTLDLGTTSQTTGAVSVTSVATIQNGTISPASLIASNASGTATVSSAVAGSTGISMTGAGTLLLSGNSSYTGTTIVATGGTLQIGHSNALGSTSGVTAVGLGATFDLNGQSTAEQFGDNVSNDGFSGTGIGGLGTLVNSSATPASITGNIFTNAFNALGTGSNGFYIGSGDIALTGTISRRNAGVSAFTIRKVGTGTLTIGGTSNNSNLSIVVDAGTLILAKNGNALATNDVTINSGATLKMDPVNQSTNTLIWEGQVANQVFLNDGTWDLNDTAGVNNRVKHVVGTGLITNSGTGTALMNIANRDAAATWNYLGNIQDGMSGGKVAVSFTNGGWSGLQTNVFGGINTYSGATSIDQAILQAGSTTALSPNSAYSLTGNVNSRLDLNGNNNTIGSLAGGANSSVLLGSATLTTGGDNSSTSYSGSISGSGALVKVGTGTMTLAGINTYSGSTTVNGGKLVTTIAISNGAALNASGGGTVEVPLNGTSTAVTSIGAVTLSGTGSHIELHDNDLISNYGAGPTNYSAIVSQVKSGLVLLGGSGTEGISSAEVDAQTVQGTILAVVDDGDPAISGAITTTSGFTIPNPTSSTIVKFTWFGDSNLDGIVDGSDYALLDSGFTSGGSLGGWVFGDYDYSGVVDGSDYALIDTGFISQNAVLPEPTTLGLLGLGAMGMLRRRRVD